MVNPYPSWSGEEQQRQWRLAAEGDGNARNRLIEGNLPLAMVAGRFGFSPQGREDLIQAGAVGLVQAVDGFDPERGRRFSSYALPFILGEMRRCRRNGGGWSRETAAIYQKVAAARADHRARHLAEPTMAALAEILGLDSEALIWALEPPEIWEDADILRDPTAQEAFEGVENREWVASLLSHLNEREKDLIRKRFFQNLTQQEIAAAYHLSQAQVSRLERGALIRLRVLLRQSPPG